MLTKNGGVITNDGFLECMIFVQGIVYNAHRRNNALQTMLWFHATNASSHLQDFRKFVQTDYVKLFD